LLGGEESIRIRILILWEKRSSIERERHEFMGIMLCTLTLSYSLTLQEEEGEVSAWVHPAEGEGEVNVHFQ
jgi:hypothetical protein